MMRRGSLPSLIVLGLVALVGTAGGLALAAHYDLALLDSRAVAEEGQPVGDEMSGHAVGLEGPGLALHGSQLSGSSALADERKQRYFLFIGQANSAAWKWMIENPSDRQAAMSRAFERLGGKMLSYYWGLGNGRNYITVSIPDDNELIQAIYTTRLGDGLLDEYEAIELMTSADMVEALKRVKEVKEIEKAG
jgi:uncharacterized protein with GYD domain